ncbi:unnamed protein product [Boreogadus saida]
MGGSHIEDGLGQQIATHEPYLQGLQRPLLPHQPPPKQQGRYSEPPPRPSPPLPPAGPWGPPGTRAISSSSDGAHARRFRRKSAGTSDRHHAKHPPASPPVKLCSPCLERLLQAKDSVVSGRRVQEGEGEGGSRGKVSSLKLLYLKHVQRRHRR